MPGILPGHIPAAGALPSLARKVPQIWGALQHSYQIAARGQRFSFAVSTMLNITALPCVLLGVLANRKFGPSRKALCCAQHGYCSPPAAGPPDAGSDWPLFLQVVQRFAKSRLWRCLLCFRPCQQCVKKGLCPFLPLFVPFFCSNWKILFPRQTRALRYRCPASAVLSVAPIRAGISLPRQTSFDVEPSIPLCGSAPTGCGN